MSQIDVILKPIASIKKLTKMNLKYRKRALDLSDILSLLSTRT